MPKQGKSALAELEQIELAVALIHLGARMQILESEVDLSRSKLIGLYKEIRGMSPPKGMLPFSADWFVTWRPNIHASLFFNIFDSLQREIGCDRMTAMIKAYTLYLEQAGADGEPVLSLTRAWTLLRFVESDQLQLADCTCCSGRYLIHAYTPKSDYVCGICRPPSRAGKKGASYYTSSLKTPAQYKECNRATA